MFQAILFDLGDTLLDFEPMNERAVFREAARTTYTHLLEKGCRLPAFGTYWRRHFLAVWWGYLWSRITRGELNTMPVLKRLAARHGVATDDDTLERLGWLWYAPVVDRASVAEDLIPTLQHLRDSGLKLGLISNTFIPGCILDRHLGMVGLRDFFPVRVYSSEVGCRKPHPRIFRMALDQLGVSARDALFVGDVVKTDIVGARGVGMRTVLRQINGSVPNRHKADHVVKRISEIPAIVFKSNGQVRQAPAPHA